MNSYSEVRETFKGSDLKLRPKTLTIEDLPFLFASDAFFARKFDETIDGEVLDKLEKMIAPE